MGCPSCDVIPPWARGKIQWRRNTSRENGISTMQMVFGRPSWDLLPVHKRALARRWQLVIRDLDNTTAETKPASRYSKDARKLQHLSVGTPGLIQDRASKRWARHGTIVEVGWHRDYFIQFTSGRVWRMNRKFVHRSCGANWDYIYSPCASFMAPS